MSKASGMKARDGVGGEGGGAQGLSQRKCLGTRNSTSTALPKTRSTSGQETVGEKQQGLPRGPGAGQPVVVSVWLRMKGVLPCCFLREALGRLEPPQREQGRKVGRGHGRAAAVMEGLGESLWGALLPCHLTNPQENPHYLLRPPELEF